MRIPPWIRCNAARFWSLANFKYTIVVGASLWAMFIQMEYRVPSGFIFILLPWIGLALSALSILFLVKHLLTRLPAKDPLQTTLARMEWWFSLLIRGFIYYSLFLYANGKLDHSMPLDRPAELLEITGGEIGLGKLIPYSWAELRFRDDPERPIRLFLQSREERLLWGGDALVVQVRQGYFGLSWVTKIERDEEYYSKNILKLMPTAALAWRNLVTFYIQHQRWKEASIAARDYLKVYPNDYEFTLYAGGELTGNRYYDEGIPLLEHVVERKPTYEAYQALGWALSYAGNKPRAAEVLEASIPLNPDDYEAYYHLGYVYSEMGKYSDAIAMFEKTLERQPIFPEVEREIAKLRKALATHRQ